MHCCSDLHQNLERVYDVSIDYVWESRDGFEIVHLLRLLWSIQWAVTSSKQLREARSSLSYAVKIKKFVIEVRVGVTNSLSPCRHHQSWTSASRNGWSSWTTYIKISLSMDLWGPSTSQYWCSPVLSAWKCGKFQDPFIVWCQFFIFLEIAYMLSLK